MTTSDHLLTKQATPVVCWLGATLRFQRRGQKKQAPDSRFDAYLGNAFVGGDQACASSLLEIIDLFNLIVFNNGNVCNKNSVPGFYDYDDEDVLQYGDESVEDDQELKIFSLGNQAAFKRTLCHLFWRR